MFTPSPIIAWIAGSPAGVTVSGKLARTNHRPVDLVEPDALAQALLLGDRVGFFHALPLNSETSRGDPLLPHTRCMADREATTAIQDLMPLAVTLGLRADDYSADQVVLSMDWAPSLCTADGILHGGVIMALAASARGACSLLNLPQDSSGTTTIESKTNFLGAVRGGAVSATATLLHRGATTIVVETAVRDEAGKR